MLALAAHASVAASRACTWIRDTDYRGINNTEWHGGENMTKEGCCALCQETAGCDFVVWSPTQLNCWFKTAGAVPFSKPGDVSCCPHGELSCPSAPEPSGWRLLTDFSDEFAAAGSGALLPTNLSKWETAPSSWGQWSWDPRNVGIVSSTTSQQAEGEVAGSYMALSMTYDPHERDNTTIFYRSGIAKSTLPAGVTFGRFEARIKGSSKWPGVCPAFWAYRHTAGTESAAETAPYWQELDFVEMLENGASPRDVDFTSHVFPPTPGVPQHIANSTHALMDFDPRDDFHTYAMEWNSSQLTWWVDDRIVKALPSAPFFNHSDRPMDVVLSFGLRDPLRTTPSKEGFPTTFWVDYVRVWQRSA